MVSSSEAYANGEHGELDASSVPAVISGTANKRPESPSFPPPRSSVEDEYSVAKFRTDNIYDSYAGTDIVADLILPNEANVTLGELQTLSYSMHRENMAARTLGHVMPVGFAKSSRTLAGSMIFTVFNSYAFYRLEHFKHAVSHGLYPVADMLPPFDLNITMSNEFGALSKFRIFGVTFVDEGGTMSVDDMILESTFTYMARGIQPLTGYHLPPSK